MTIYKYILLSISILISSMLWSQTVPPPTTNTCIGEQGKIKWLYWNNVERSTIDYLHVHNSFPQGPSGFQYITQLDSPRGFSDYMGSKMTGYFTVPETGTYEFNLMGDDRANFYLSTDDDPANLVLEISLNGVTGRTDFYGHPESISVPINLTAGNYYYFEVEHKEQTGDDYARLFWHAPSFADMEWQIVPVNHIYENLCDASVCPPMGEPCDDNDANTTNDRQDGSCNCIGDQPAPFECVGRQGILQSLTWRGIPGSSVSNLLADPRFPLMPDTVEFITNYNHFSQYNTMPVDEYGSLIKGYMTVPITGDYQFNVTADDRGILNLSTDEEPFNMTQVCNTINGNGIFEHDEHPEQTSSLIPMIAGQYYYFEFYYKEGTGTNRYHIYWKTPSVGGNNWKVIPLTYLYEYRCETACLPDGTPCTDEDSSTFGDVVTGCNCAGVPCPGGDCTELETYTPYDACDYKDEHSGATGNSWLSCTISPNPNSNRGDSHWILYDFNEVYSLNASTIYNYNVTGSTGSGLKDIVVDYSVNGTDWVEAGSYQLPQASGSSNYAGIIGPDLAGVAAKYVLITALTVWDNGNCAGFSEIIFDATTCPDAGTVCDDGDPTTTDDRYDGYCNCKGIGLPVNDCTVDTIIIADSPAQSKTYAAIKYIESDLIVDQHANTSFVAGEEIFLGAGFETELGANFCATIIPCTGTSSLGESTPNAQIQLQNHNAAATPFFVRQDINQKIVYTKLEQKEATLAVLKLTDYKGTVLLEENILNEKGIFDYKIDLSGYENGVYTISMEAKGLFYTERIVIQ